MQIGEIKRIASVGSEYLGTCVIATCKEKMRSSSSSCCRSRSDKDCFSDLLPTSCGVPQGSVFRPLLFTLYTTQLSSVIQRRNLDHHLYADDPQIYVSFTTPDTCRSIDQLRDCLQDVSLWMKYSKLKLNANKTKLLIIGTSTQRAKLDGFFPIHILSHNITQAASVFNLGVTFDNNFNFKTTYIENVIFAVFAGLYNIQL